MQEQPRRLFVVVGDIGGAGPVVARPDITADSLVIAEVGGTEQQALLRRIGFVSTGRAGRRPGRMLMSWRAAPAYRIDVC